MKEFKEKTVMEQRFGMISTLMMSGMVDYDEVMRNIPEWERYKGWCSMNQIDKNEKRRVNMVLDLLYDMRKEGRRQGVIR